MFPHQPPHSPLLAPFLLPCYSGNMRQTDAIHVLQPILSPEADKIFRYYRAKRAAGHKGVRALILTATRFGITVEDAERTVLQLRPEEDILEDKKVHDRIARSTLDGLLALRDQLQEEALEEPKEGELVAVTMAILQARNQARTQLLNVNDQILRILGTVNSKFSPKAKTEVSLNIQGGTPEQRKLAATLMGEEFSEDAIEVPAEEET